MPDAAESFRQSLLEFNNNATSTGGRISGSPTAGLKQWFSGARNTINNSIRPTVGPTFIRLQPQLSTQPSPSKLSNLDCCQCSRVQRLVGFVACSLAGLLCFMVASFTLPVVILKPQKFALSYTAGSLLILSSFAWLLGPVEYGKHLISTERRLLTASYLGSLIATIYAVLVIQSYVWIVICCVLQLVAVAWYYVSYLPGGLQAMRTMTRTVLRAVV